MPSAEHLVMVVARVARARVEDTGAAEEMMAVIMAAGEMVGTSAESVGAD